MKIYGKDKIEDNRSVSHKARIKGAVVVTIYSLCVYAHVYKAAACHRHIEILITFKELIQT
jgi:hypothetical protein